jgi:hypothetical protein
MSDESIIDRLVTAYLINERILKEIMVDPWSHPCAVPEEIMCDMATLWSEMIECIPESHSLRILSIVYGE